MYFDTNWSQILYISFQSFDGKYDDQDKGKDEERVILDICLIFCVISGISPHIYKIKCKLTLRCFEFELCN